MNDMNFGQVIELFKNGKHVNARRRSWVEQERIFYVPECVYTFTSGFPPFFFVYSEFPKPPGGPSVRFLHIDKDQKHTIWKPSHQDLLAEDWIEIAPA